MTLHWAVPFIGKSPEQVNFCWGFLREAYKSFGISLPPVEGITRTNAEEVGKASHYLMEDWIEVEKPFDRCAVGMGQTDTIHHVGVYTSSDGGLIVHCWGDCNVIAEPLRRIRLRGFKTIKFYRHKLWPTS